MRALPAVLIVLAMMLPVPAWAAPTERTLEISTVPPMPAARFVLDGQQVVPDARGAVRLTLPRNSDAHRLELATPKLDLADGSIDFVRWFGQGERDLGFTPVLTDLEMKHNRRLQVAFQSTRRVRYDFVDQAHNPVSPSRVSALTLRSDSGQIQTLRGVQEVPLTAIRPVQEGATAVGKEVRYYLQSVEIDGANVVNAGEQRIVPARATSVTFVVLLRSVRFQVSDLLFGSAMNAEVALTYPDGRTENLAVGQDGTVAVDNLARGNYTVAVSAAGYARSQQLALSRGQRVDLRVLSYVDTAVIVALAVLIFAGLFLMGRRRMRSHRDEAR
ncbi:carboxypeptidase-like regulatory domain-containing protein [Lentzea nigeriaca]|uniref:carboxypeptidase-like regulatory domain-containing protein n=1 Tax=Lentzea nigeriaca TaxID=1128665 RepID=UPI001959806C|nr:carboxypeptidase-like regulatory domain-containing protein [Lentzea nigeriaca]MBM7857217.1 hypothetical protein [Lentzea nigeriaca]